MLFKKEVPFDVCKVNLMSYNNNNIQVELFSLSREDLNNMYKDITDYITLILTIINFHLV